MKGILILAIVLSVMAVLAGIAVYLGVKTARCSKKTACSKVAADDEADDKIGDEQIAAVAGGGEAISESWSTNPPRLLKCDKCGKVVSREEFMLSGRCPACGCGVLKVLQK